MCSNGHFELSLFDPFDLHGRRQPEYAALSPASGHCGLRNRNPQPPNHHYFCQFHRTPWLHSPDGFAPVFGGAVPSKGRFGGPVSRNFGENLILYLRKPNCKQSRGSKCFCVKGLSQVGQVWQSLRFGPPENCPRTPYSPRELGLYGPRATHGFPGF